MPLALQAKLLRFLESGELQRVGENETTQVNVRILAATHQPLARRAQEGSFRADLFYRLSVFRIETPALCDHPEDLPALAAHFLERLGEGCPKSLEPAAMARLRAHCWPGNVRELQHVLERAAILAEDRAGIGPAEIEFDLP
jgi:DNA-binding NtrC family response regulator